MERVVCVLFALLAVTVAFAWHSEEPSADAERPRFTRDAEPKKFAFAFAKRSADTDESGAFPRFAKDLEDKNKFAFAFAKRGEDMRRFARDLGVDESNPRFAFAKRGDDELSRFARLV